MKEREELREMNAELADMLWECITDKAELQQSHAELLEALKTCVGIIPGMDVPLCADEAIAKAEKLK